MSNRKFEMHHYRQVIVRLRLGDTIRSIANAGLASRKKIRIIQKMSIQQGWLNIEHELPSDEILAKYFKRISTSPVTQSSVLIYQEQIEAWCKQGIQASTICAALQRNHGFNGSYDSVQRFVKKFKDTTSVDVTTILEFKPAECAQIDFGAGPKLINESTGEIISTWIFVMVLAWSRHMYAEIVLKQDVATWLGCHWRAFTWFGGIPNKTTIDNPKCAITKACYYDPEAQRSYSEFAQECGFMISPCPPREPKKKGRVESGVKYVKNNFVPLRNFRDLVDANEQLKKWILETAGNRNHGTTHEKPLTLFATEQLLLEPLPDNPPECAVWQKVILQGDCHVSYLKCRYSAPYKLAKQILWLRATETTVRLYQENTLVAMHPRLFGAGPRSTLDEHLPPNAVAYCMKDPQWCLEQARRIGSYCEKVVDKLLTHSVVDHLRAAQGIVGLQKKYGDARLDAACRRALAFECPRYRPIKDILNKGLEYAALPEQDAFDALAKSYTGKGRFDRDPSLLLQ
jgi:transposase